MHKKAISILGSIIMMLLLVACGSNSRKDPTPPPAPPPGGYMFVNVTSDLLIEEYITYPIAFQLTKDGLAVEGAEVSMKVPDKSVGSIKKLKVVTDENGKGRFVFTPPVIFPDKGQLTMVFTDGNITLEQTVDLTFNLKSDIPTDGHPTVLSITYETTECDEKLGIISHYHVHAVDRFSRIPVANVPVSISLVNGIKKIHDKNIQEATGSIYNFDPVEFIDKTVNFATQTNVKEGDNLIILPSEGKTNSAYIGGWDISAVGKNNLLLVESYNNLENTTNLTYIIGNEKRLLGGENGTVGIPANAHVVQDYTTDNEGYAYFDIVYDPILAGHTVVVEAHGNDDGNRIGTAMKIGLRLDGDSFTASEVVVPNTRDLQIAQMHLRINPSCTGDQPLIDVPTNPGSYHIDPIEHCQIIFENSDFKTNGYGNVKIAVQGDGNVTAAESCTLTWDGSVSSLFYEY